MAEEQQGPATPSILWHYMKNGKAEGPVPQEQIRSMMVKQELTLNDMVWHSGMSNWIFIKDSQELKLLFSSGTSSAPVSGAVGRAATGGCMGVVLVIVGVLLCCTVIGAIIGIPLILVGIGSPLIGMGTGLADIIGKCPYCGTEVRANKLNKGKTCPACKKRFVVRNKQFIPVA